MSGYDAVMQIKREQPEWLPAVVLCYQHRGQFRGQHILEQLPDKHGRTLRPLVKSGVIEHVRSVAGGAWYRVSDRDGVGRALRQLRLVWT